MPTEKKTKPTTRRTKAKAAVPEVVPESSSAAAAVAVPDVTEVLQGESTPVPQETVPVSTMTSSRRRVIPNKEELQAGFDEMVSTIQLEMDARRDDKSHTVTLKTLKTLMSDVKRLRTNSLKMCRKTRRRASTPEVDADGNEILSGFKKPVSISKGLLKFTGWNPEENYSRNDVTRFICDYIKKNELQKPEDRRVILPDRKLSKLLGYSAKDSEPLTYFRIQKLIQPHYI